MCLNLFTCSKSETVLRKVRSWNRELGAQVASSAFYPLPLVPCPAIGFKRVVSLRLITLLVLFLLSCSVASAQSLKPQGHFSADTLKVGEPVYYTLTFRYPRDLEVVFPDEGANYATFEYLDRQFAPTHSDSLFSYDSVVYEMSTFELDSVQSLTLPVYVVEVDESGFADSVAIYADIDSIFLRQILVQMPDSLALKQNTNLQTVPLQFNYPYLLVGIGIVLTLLLLLYILFGKQLRRRWRIRRLRQANQKFSARYDQALATLEAQPNEQHAEAALVMWKTYMEKLSQIPYTKMTTREIAQLPSGTDVREELRAIDRNIYGSASEDALVYRFEQLGAYAHLRFEQRIEEVKHG